MKTSKKILIFIVTISIFILSLAIIDKRVNKSIDFSNVNLLTLEKLYEMNSDIPVEFEYNNSGNISRIEGTLANFKIYDHNDALRAIYSLKDILYLCDIKDLKYKDEVHNQYNDIYYFQQYINDIKVKRGVVTLLVDADKKDAYIVNSYCISASGINTTYKIDKNEAIRIVKSIKEYDVNKITKTELVIYNDSVVGNVLAWYIETNSYRVPYLYINAYTGEILYVDSPRDYS